jgi:iron complex outermembrane receptor protein
MDYLQQKISIRLTHTIYKTISVSWNALYQDRAGDFLKYHPENGTFTTYPYDPFWIIHGKIIIKSTLYKAYIEVSNILDHLYYDIGNVVQPGRWLTGGVTLNLDKAF